jgi:hypothetical protein
MEATTAKIPDATVIGLLAVAFVYFPELGLKCGSSTVGGAAGWGSPSFQRTMEFNVGHFNFQQPTFNISAASASVNQYWFVC